MDSIGVDTSGYILTYPWKPRVSSFFVHGALLLISPIIVGLVIYFARYAAEDLQRFPTAPASFVSEASPVASIAVSTTEDEAHCSAKPANGAVLAGSVWQGDSGHRIDAQNGAASSAIVKVRDATTGQLIVAVFVEPKARVNMGPFPDGIYEIQYALGADLSSDCKSFSKPSFVAEFPLPESLQSDDVGGQTVTQRPSYTLYSAASGELGPHPIDEALFDAD